MTKDPRGSLRAGSRAVVVAGVLTAGCVGNPPPPPQVDTSGTTGEGSTGSGSSTGSGFEGSDVTEPPDSTGAEPVCGNGIIEADELCDDGNTEDDDGCASDCLAAHCLVPVTHPTVQAGVDDPGCPTVWVLAGTYQEQVIVDRDLHLRETDSGDAVIDAAGAGRPLTVEAVTVVVGGLRLTGGVEADGGGIYSAGTLTLEQTEVVGNLATGPKSARGGGIFNDGGTLTLVGARIEANTADAQSAMGGGIDSEGGTIVLLAQSEVSENTAQFIGMVGGASGGGIRVAGAELVITEGSRVGDNVARVEVMGGENVSAQGGGVLVSGSTLEVDEGGRIEANRVEVVGETEDLFGGMVGQGGGVRATSSMLTFTNAEIRDNQVIVEGVTESASASGGGLAVTSSSEVTMLATLMIGNESRADAMPSREGFLPTFSVAQGGALYARVGTSTDTVSVALTECTVQSNRAAATTRAESSNSSASGGAAHVESGTGDSVVTVELTRSTVVDNSAEADSASGGAIFANSGTGRAQTWAIATGTTLSGNRAEGTSTARGGAFYVDTSTGEAQTWGIAVNSTLSGNMASTTDPMGTARGGAMFVGDGISLAFAYGRIYSSTITDNAANQAGALFVSGDQLDVELASSIAQDNSAVLDPDLGCTGGTITSAGYNLVGSIGGCGMGAGTDLIGQDALLLPLADNGGPTLTHALQPASLAHDGGNPLGCTDSDGMPLTTDQRGEPRPAEAACDIGAFELQP